MSAAISLQTPLKFLVVDDSRAIQAIIRRAIAHCGYTPVEVRTANNGEDALEQLESFTPDLVITDWHMPKVSGLEMVQAMRQWGHKNTRVGFVTTERSEDLLSQAISSGAMFILNKPFDDAELINAVGAVVKDLADQQNPAPAQPVDTPLPMEAMTRQLKKYLNNIPFRLIPRDSIKPANLTSNVVLGLYGASNHKGAYAVAVMDANAVCMIGGASRRSSPNEVRAAMALGLPDANYVGPAEQFLRSMEESLAEYAKPRASKVTLAKASMVKSTLPKLLEVLAQTELRSDYRLSIPGYGDGRIAFFIMKV
jgi:CheY-like chemotaxis protein